MTHPNSLKNLKPITDPDRAREIQKLSVASRKRNKAMRDEFLLTAKNFAEVMDKVDLDPEKALVMALMIAVNNADQEAIVRISKELIPYRKPKLASTEVKVSGGLSDLTDEQLQEEYDKLQELNKGLKQDEVR